MFPMSVQFQQFLKTWLVMKLVKRHVEKRQELLLKQEETDRLDWNAMFNDDI